MLDLWLLHAPIHMNMQVLKTKKLIQFTPILETALFLLATAFSHCWVISTFTLVSLLYPCLLSLFSPFTVDSQTFRTQSENWGNWSIPSCLLCLRISQKKQSSFINFDGVAMTTLGGSEETNFTSFSGNSCLLMHLCFFDIKYLCGYCSWLLGHVSGKHRPFPTQLALRWMVDGQ